MGISSIETEAFDVDAGGEVVAEVEIERDDLSGGEIDHFSNDGDDPSFEGSRACDVSEVFFGI